MSDPTSNTPGSTDNHSTDPDNPPTAHTMTTQAVRQLNDEVYNRWFGVNARLMSALPDNTLSIAETELHNWLNPVDTATWLATIEINGILQTYLDSVPDGTEGHTHDAPVPADILRGLSAHIEYNTVRDIPRPATDGTAATKNTTVLTLGVSGRRIGQTPQIVSADTSTYLTIYRDIYRRFTDAVGYRITPVFTPVTGV